MKFIVKTQMDMEAVAGNYIREVLPNAKVTIAPEGYPGIVIVESEEENALQKILEVPEVEKVYPVLIEVPANLDSIKSAADEIVKYKGRRDIRS